jgi:hypothetical protein
MPAARDQIGASVWGRRAGPGSGDAAVAGDCVTVGCGAGAVVEGGGSKLGLGGDSPASSCPQ